MRKQVRHFQARVTVPLERPFRAENDGIPKLPILKIRIAETGGRVLSIQLLQDWLGVKRINMAWPALHEQMDHALGRSGKGRCLGSQGVGGLRRRARHGRSAEQVQRGQPAETKAAILKELSPCFVSPHKPQPVPVRTGTRDGPSPRSGDTSTTHWTQYIPEPIFRAHPVVPGPSRPAPGKRGRCHATTTAEHGTTTRTLSGAGSAAASIPAR